MVRGFLDLVNECVRYGMAMAMAMSMPFPTSFQSMWKVKGVGVLGT